MLEAGLVNLLTSDSALTALIGQRLYGDAAPAEQNVFPYLIYKSISDPGEYAFAGNQNRVRHIDFIAYSMAKIDCLNILQVLRNLLDGYQGTLSDGTRVLAAWRIDVASDFQSSARTISGLQEYAIQYVEP